jgi:hypothetical protein
VDLRRVRPAELLALLSGVALLTSMFLPWYEFASGRLDAWDSLTVALVPLTLAAAAGIYLFTVTLTQRSPALPVSAAVWTTLLGAIAVVFAVVRTAALPGAAHARCYGLWIGLVATVAVAIAGWWALADERPLRGVRVHQR